MDWWMQAASSAPVSSQSAASRNGMFEHADTRRHWHINVASISTKGAWRTERKIRELGAPRYYIGNPCNCHKIEYGPMY